MTAGHLGLSPVGPVLRGVKTALLRHIKHLPKFSYFKSEVRQQHFASKAINKLHDYRKYIRKESCHPVHALPVADCLVLLA